jgi:hypothetical protein
MPAMKTLSRVALVVLVLVASTGCANTAKLVTQLKNDPAIVVHRLRTIYGTSEFTRIGGQSNEVHVATDGTVTIKPVARP